MDNTTFFTRRHALQWAAAASASTTLSAFGQSDWPQGKAITLSLIHISEPTRPY